eukprot:1158892-Pelagomonas_calceolata.AAC.28
MSPDVWLYPRCVAERVLFCCILFLDHRQMFDCKPGALPYPRCVAEHALFCCARPLQINKPLENAIGKIKVVEDSKAVSFLCRAHPCVQLEFNNLWQECLLNLSIYFPPFSSLHFLGYKVLRSSPACLN